jgi:hypothetical protein
MRGSMPEVQQLLAIRLGDKDRERERAAKQRNHPEYDVMGICRCSPLLHQHTKELYPLKQGMRFSDAQCLQRCGVHLAIDAIPVYLAFWNTAGSMHLQQSNIRSSSAARVLWKCCKRTHTFLPCE